ncbi:MAG: ABC transporter substrate-binding protein [Desulfohalobiaceae bacterium]|nr:ABC transporter substrate-binding protein [Desulfohalobiaceae bacterium]
MKNCSKVFVFGFLSFFLICISAAFAEDQGFATKPVRKNGEKWRIGYYQGGAYIDYLRYTESTIKGLMELGWIKSEELPPRQGERIKPLWDWLSGDAESEYIEFVGDAFYTAEWDQEKRQEAAAGVIKRLKDPNDLDMVLALGTWAGQDLANDRHQTPVIVISASDPVGSGIIKSARDSGFGHVHARVDPNRYYRQIRIFSDIIGFSRLGVAYEDSQAGRTYAALGDIERASKDTGFEISTCHTLGDIPDQEKANASVIKCYKELAQNSDAVYVTVQSGVNSQTLPELVKIFNSHNIPTFSQAGSQEVKAGILLSIAQADYKYAGQFWAETIAEVFNGARPGQLPQVFEEPPNIAINLKTAEEIGFNPPVDVLGAADRIFQTIEKP